MPSVPPGNRLVWEEVLDNVLWMRAFPQLTPDKIDDLPIDFYNHGREINNLCDARANGVDFTEAEDGWEKII